MNGGAYRTEYEWTCPACQKREKFDPLKEAASLVRRPDADLDLSTETRHRLWNEPKTLAETNARLSSHLGESDKDVYLTTSSPGLTESYCEQGLVWTAAMPTPAR